MFKVRSKYSHKWILIGNYQFHNSPNLPYNLYICIHFKKPVATSLNFPDLIDGIANIKKNSHCLFYWGMDQSHSLILNSVKTQVKRGKTFIVKIPLFWMRRNDFRLIFYSSTFYSNVTFSRDPSRNSSHSPVSFDFVSGIVNVVFVWLEILRQHAKW